MQRLFNGGFDEGALAGALTKEAAAGDEAGQGKQAGVEGEVRRFGDRRMRFNGNIIENEGRSGVQELNIEAQVEGAVIWIFRSSH